MSRSRVALVVLFFATFLVAPSPVQASSTVVCTGYTSCSGKGYSHFGYASAKGTSYWNMYTGTNCTNYVAYRLVTTNGMPNKRPKSGVGNARDWGTAMASVTDSTPTVGSVAWWGKTGNHVAYVERVVSSSEIWVSESNWSGAFDWRKVTRSGGGWPDGFIHFTAPTLVNSVKPAISGSVKVSTTLKASGGTWSPSGNTYAYQWLLDGAAISGATSTSYRPMSTQVGKALSVRVTASRSGYPATTATSASTAVSPGTLSVSTRPSIAGRPQVGQRLTAATGSWSRSDITYGYQWLSGGAPIAGATGSSYVPAPADVARPITVQVTGTRFGFAPTTSTADSTSAVAPGVLTRDTAPSITGTPRVGSRLTVSGGSWSPSADLAFQWSADGAPVAGATDRTFVPTHRERGKTVRVRVTASRPGYTTATATATRTAAVATGRIRVGTPPSVTGSPELGSVLTIQPGVVTPAGASVRYQWLRDGKVLSGATRERRKVSSNDLGRRLSAWVTYKATGYSATTATTATTRPVRSTPKLSVSATSPRAGSVTFTLRVTASRVTIPGGSVTVRDPAGRSQTVRLTKGRATVTLTKQAAGPHVYRLEYRGTSTVAPASREKSVTVR